jgi:hypothetical protein
MSTHGYYRWPTIHDDTVVFVCEDDLWSVAASGGVARRLTANPGSVQSPALSPDGTLLAFVGRDEGPGEVFVMLAVGGEARRLTFLGAEIDSYIDSPEYLEAFGDNIVPHPRGFEYRKAHTTRDFTNLFALYGGYANNDRSQGRRPRLMIPLATGFTPAIRRIGVRGLLPPSPISKHLGPPTGQSDRMFCIEVTRLLNPPSALATSSRVRKSNQQIFVSADQLSATMQRLLKAGAKIVSVRSA